MGQRNTDTAVLIFSLSAKREAERKGLFGRGKKQSARRFFEILIGQTKKIAAESGVDAFLIDEGKQQGLTFGERYANAFQELFDQGYTKVVSIGNDAPNLTAETLRKAIEEIQCNDVVVGPSTDGGMYLLGLSRSIFNTDEFLNLPWLKDSLCDIFSQSNYWQQKGSFCLDVLSDIDDTTSLLQFVQTASNDFLVRFILLHLLCSTTRFGHPIVFPILDANDSSVSLRGPPSHLSYSKRVTQAA